MKIILLTIFVAFCSSLNGQDVNDLSGRILFSPYRKADTLYVKNLPDKISKLNIPQSENKYLRTFRWLKSDELLALEVSKGYNE